MENKIITIYELIGLIKDNKAPKKIKIDDDIWYFIKKDNENYYVDKGKYCLHCCQLEFDYYIEENKLNTIVEVLSEETDEWEDIKELIYVKDPDFSNSVNVQELNEVLEVQNNRLNQLIRNQKYLKERLDKNE